jgi:hypothetical protein
MHRFILTALLFLVIYVAPLSASTLNEEMQRASSALIDLMPYIYNDEAFRNQKNRSDIDQKINELISVVEATPSLLQEHTVTLEISQQNLLASLKQARSLFHSGAYSTSQYLLSGAPIVCSSCHIQDGQQARMTQTMNRDLFANDFTFAEFNYYLRNYQQAKQAYAAHLMNPKVQTSRIQAAKTLERQLDLALITNSSTEPAKALLATAKSLPKLDMEVKQTIDLWQQGLKEINLNTVTLTELESQIYAAFSEQFTLEHEFIFNEVNRPRALIWRLQLHKQLRNTVNRKDTARALYLLSILERTLGDQIDISLSNLYLKECIRLNVKGYSGKCLSEYENHLYFYYGGSSGEHLPGAILKELDQLKQQHQQGT